MAADKLCCRMYNDVGTVLDRAELVWCGKSTVDDQRNAVFVCDLRYGFDIENIGIRVAKCLCIEKLGVFLDCFSEVLRIRRIYECGLDALLTECVGQKVKGTTIDVLGRNDVITGCRDILNGICNRSRTGRNSESSNTKGKNINWATPTLNGKGLAVYDDASGKAKFRKQQVFTTLAAAKAYLNGKANIS